MKKGIAILGSTGSIGTQALEVISENNDLFDVKDDIDRIKAALNY